MLYLHSKIYLLLKACHWSLSSPLIFSISMFCWQRALLLSQSDVTHPSISVGIRTRKQGMENDDCFIQVPDENSLESRGEERSKEKQKRGKINGALCRTAKWSSWSIGQEHVFVCHRDQDPFAWVGHRNTSPITPPHAFHLLPFTLE